MSSRKSFKILCIPQFFLSASTNNRSVLGVFLFFKFKTETILPLIVKIPTKISALQKKKINQRQQMYDSSKHSCHSMARPRSSSKLAGVPTQMFIVLHAGYKKKNIPLSQNSQTRGKQRLPIVVPTTSLICSRVMCAPICKMIKWRKFETVFILIFITDFFILLIYIVSWIAWKYLTKALFIHVCIVLFSRGKRWLFGLIIGRKKNDEKCHESMECTYIGESILPVRS